MSNQDVFLNLPTEPAPRNRRIYAAAKLPFLVLFGVLVWVATPWLCALPLGMLASAVVSAMVNQDAVQTEGLRVVAQNTILVGAVWTFYLGCVFAVLRVLKGLFG